MTKLEFNNIYHLIIKLILINNIYKLNDYFIAYSPKFYNNNIALYFI